MGRKFEKVGILFSNRRRTKNQLTDYCNQYFTKREIVNHFRNTEEAQYIYLDELDMMVDDQNEEDEQNKYRFNQSQGVPPENICFIMSIVAFYWGKEDNPIGWKVGIEKKGYDHLANQCKEV